MSNFVQYNDQHPVNLANITTFYKETGNDYAWIVFRVPNGDKILWTFKGDQRFATCRTVYQSLLKDMLK